MPIIRFVVSDREKEMIQKYADYLGQKNNKAPNMSGCIRDSVLRAYRDNRKEINKSRSFSQYY